MMINRRLIGVVPGSMRYIWGNVALQWLSLMGNIVLMTALARFLQSMYLGEAGMADLYRTLGIAAAAAVVRFGCTIGANRMSFLSSRTVKQVLRAQIYEKLLRLGSAYREQVQTSAVVQMAVEGVEQLETYFGSYLPQFFYAMLAPLTLFVFVSFISLPSALVLLLCVPLIPVSIAAVQTWAKKLLGKYWGEYTALGDTFLENLQGLTTLKIYQADGFKHREMNEQAERFRKITMKVLTMQLNSITIMDLIAYGGAALGVILAATGLRSGRVDAAGALLIILLAADFFLPMRQLGSFFHVAMNGMAASDRIFALLDLPEPEEKTESVPQEGSIRIQGLRFAYEEGREVLQDVSLEIPRGGFTAIAGESGSGKSTLASILMGRCRGYTGSVTLGGTELREIREDSLLDSITCVGSQSYLFKGTVRDNLLMGAPGASEEQMWAVLERTRLAPFLRTEQGLDTMVMERGSNLSGGQCQRLALARALLHDTPMYIFDEATSNIDVESENDILAEIHALAKEKTVLLISHRLANVATADKIYVLEHGRLTQQGNHQELLARPGQYAKLWAAQQELENFGKDRVPA